MRIVLVIEPLRAAGQNLLHDDHWFLVAVYVKDAFDDFLQQRLIRRKLETEAGSNMGDAGDNKERNREIAHNEEVRQTTGDIRVVVAMNYYTPSCPESDRPGDLTPHLFDVVDA